ncbi:MAG TPA: methyltransferase domain-containing protein [Jatrophihabitans sp.]|nr:methyltransferase domain-containing protein [Jatrophihabitans sp.]
MPDDSLARAAALLDPARVEVGPELTHGYLNVLAALPPAPTVGARTMRTAFYPVYYERLRPLALRVATGFAAPGRAGDRARAVARLGLAAGASVLDVACGPGNFTGYFGRVVGASGLAVGLDASDSMLAKAVATNSGPSVAYLRGDAERLPFPDATFDAVSCFAALYLMSDPYAALAEIVRVLRPAGRVAVLTSFAGDHLPVRALTRVGQVTTGVRPFGRDDITGALRELGLVEVRQDVRGLAQEVWARKP